MSVCKRINVISFSHSDAGEADNPPPSGKSRKERNTGHANGKIVTVVTSCPVLMVFWISPSLSSLVSFVF